MSDPTSTKTLSDRLITLWARSFLYQLFSVFLRHPAAGDARTFTNKTADGWTLAVDVLEISDAAKLLLSKNLKALHGSVLGISDQDWASMYDHVFGHTAIGKAPAHELEYGEEHSHRQPHELADIAAFYNAFGVRSSQAVHERVDHISVECEFMYFLIQKEIYALQNTLGEPAELCRNAQRKFLGEHLALWAPAFAQRLAGQTEGGLLGAVAETLLCFIIHDAFFVDAPSGPADLPIRLVQDQLESGCVSCALRPKTPGSM